METVRFLHLSDLHFRKNYEDWGFQSLLKKLPDPLEYLEECLAKEIKRGLDFVLLTGDLSHDGTGEDYAALRDALNALLGGVPWVALPGNHDSRAPFEAELRGREAVLSPCGDAVYEVDGLRIITLDTGTGIAGEIRADQSEWLRSVLSVPGGKGSILAVHHPLIPNQEGLGVAKMDPGLPDLLAESDVLGIFCGHTHRNYIGAFAGKPYCTADSMSYVMEESGPNTYLKSAAAYTRAVLCGGTLSVQVRQLAPAPAAAACFPTNTMSTLFQKRK